MPASSQPTVNRLTQAERTKISDQRMLDATVQLVVTHGPAATRLKDVGVQAGYSRGLASHRFGSKDKLFGFVLRQLGENWVSQLTIATRGLCGLQAVERALDQHYKFCVDAPDYVRTFYSLWFESVNADTELAESIRGIHKRRHQDVVQWIISDPKIDDEIKNSAEEIAAQFCAAVIGIVYYWITNPDDLLNARMLHDGLQHTMRHLLTSPSPH